MGIKGCWTCRARKVRCDLRKPTCSNCDRALQPCKGYGMQLSWPREGNKRRVQVNRDIKMQAKMSQRYWGYDVRFLNTSSMDVALSDALQEKRNIAYPLYNLRVPHLPYFSPSLLSGNGAHLLEYFNETRTRILAPIIDESLAQFIIKMAMVNVNSSQNLVLEGIFALSSLVLLGPSNIQTHKYRLISMLKRSVTQIDRDSILQNLIATMLLYQCEVYDMANPGGLWRFYLCGAKKIISAVSPSIALYQHDCAILMDWIYYHEVMTEFSLRHWADAHTIGDFCKGPLAIRPNNIIIDDSIMWRQASNRITCPMDALDLVRNLCKRPTTNEDDDIPYNNSDMERIQQLRQNLYEIIGEYGTFHRNIESPLSRQNMMTSLYRYAALIYLNRTVLNVSTSSFSHRRLIREGILLLQNLAYCESAWPLFIIACEANEDEQRLHILDILSHTSREVGQQSHNIQLIQYLIEAIWNQNDLNIEANVNYGRILNAVISTTPSLPLFA